MAARQRCCPYRGQVRSHKSEGRCYNEPKRTSTSRLPRLSLRPAP